MPQSTLLDFFKSRNTGPFSPTGVPGSSLHSGDAHDDNNNEDSNQLPSATGLTNPKDQLANSLISEQAEGLLDVKTEITNDLIADLGLPGIAIVRVDTDHLLALKRLTSNLLPVRYPDKFFDGAVNDAIPATFSRVALIDGKPVGWIRCRLDPFPEPTIPPSNTKPIYNRLYVQVLCLLAPYRGIGIATSLLNAVIAPPLPAKYDIAHVYAHVWENNEEALEWYDRRGFERFQKVEQYYRKLRPDGAWIVKRDFADA